MSRSIATRFRENYQGFWKKYRWFVIVFTIAVLCDAASTMYFLSEPEPDTEAHPIICYLCSNWLGPVAGPLVAAIAKVAAGLAVAIYCRAFAVVILTAVSAISFWAAWYNIWGYKICSPCILDWIWW